MLNEVALQGLGTLLTVSLFITLAWFCMALRKYRKVINDMKRLACEKGVSLGSSKGMRLIRDLHGEIASSESNRLVGQAESIVPVFVFRFRVFILNAILMVAFLVVMQSK
jgi:hypothetical protein